MDKCDFCSNPKTTRRFECMDFEAASKDAGVMYDGTRDTTGPTNLIMHSINYWAACEACARYVDEEDIDGLIGYVVMMFRAGGYQITAKTIRHMRHMYELFFKHRIRVAS